MNPHMDHNAEELRALPTLAVGQADDLKIDQGGYRVWISRCGLADGAQYEDTVFVEMLEEPSGQWTTIAEYEG